MSDYRDDTLSFDKYTVQDIPAHTVKGVPAEDTFSYQVCFGDETLAKVAAQAFEPIRDTIINQDGSWVTVIATGDSALAVEVMVWGWVARQFTEDAIWRNVSADGEYRAVNI